MGGYELYITRAEHYLDVEQFPISAEEWNAFARARPDVREEGWNDWPDIGRQPSFDFTCDDGSVVTLDWRSGLIEVLGAQSEFAARSVARLSEALGARLMGEEGETYIADTTDR